MTLKSKLVLLRGLPGSGKSAKAKEIVSELSSRGYHHIFIASADNYFIRPDGKYDWNFDSLRNAHLWCQRQASDNMSAVITGEVVIVDNTNITKKDMQPYILLAEKCNFDVEEVVVGDFDRDSVETYFNRCVHKVPKDTIIKMANRFER